MFSPDTAVDKMKLLALGLVALALLLASASALFGPARKGNVRRTWDVSLASLIALVPLAIAGIGATIFAASLFGWFGLGTGN